MKKLIVFTVLILGCVWAQAAQRKPVAQLTAKQMKLQQKRAAARARARAQSRALVRARAQANVRASRRVQRLVASGDSPDLTCRFDFPNRPVTLVKYYRGDQIAVVQSGFPATIRTYTDVLERGDATNVTLLAFGGDGTLLNAKLTGNAHIWPELREAVYPFTAQWGSLQDAPKDAEGACFTPDMQPISTRYND